MIKTMKITIIMIRKRWAGQRSRKRSRKSMRKNITRKTDGCPRNAGMGCIGCRWEKGQVKMFFF